MFSAETDVDRPLRVPGFDVLYIPGRMPNLNELIDARMVGFRRGRKRINGYTEIKREWEAVIRPIALTSGVRSIGPSAFTLLCIEPNRRRDPDGFTSGAFKLLFDALQSARIMKNDGWRGVLDMRSHWGVNLEQPCVCLYIGYRVLEREEVLCPTPPNESGSSKGS